MAKNVDLNTIEEFVRNKIYPQNIAKDKGKKSNFRKACKKFNIVDGHLMYKGKRRVVYKEERRKLIIQSRCNRRQPKG